MATQTPNYHLEKPEATDNFSAFRQLFNDNMDIIDNISGGGGTAITYTLSISGHTVTLTGSNGTTSSITVPDADTTYTLGFANGVLSLTDSNGTPQTVTIPDNNTTYTMSLSGNVLTLTDSDGHAQSVTITIPTKTSDLTNDSGFITSASVPTKTSDLTNDSGFITSSALPTALSDLTNDEGFIDNTVNNLVNYYTKTQTYTQAEVDALISAIVTLNVVVVQTLPTQDISTTTIYLVPKQTTGTDDIYDEYIYVNNSWEHIGSTAIDLSNYYNKSQVDTLLADKVDKVSGKQLSTEDFTTVLLNKLNGIASGAEVNVQSDWNEADTTSDAYIQNKPTLFSGNYNDLSNKPSIPSKTSDLQNDSGFIDSSALPTKTSDLTNDSGFITSSALPTKVSDLTNDENFTSVSWNQITQTGTKIAEIEIDGNKTDVYAPTSGGGGSYTAGEGIDITNDVISLEYLSVVNGAVCLTFNEV